MSPEKPALDLVRAVERGARRGVTDDDGRPPNPFEAERVRPGVRRWVTVAGAAGESVSDPVATCLEDALVTPAGFIVGGHGTGKSTLLRNVVAAATDRGLDVVFLHPGGAIPPSRDLQHRDLIASDASGRRRPLWWLRLLARARHARTPIIATARRPWIPRIIHHRRVSPAEAEAVVRACLAGTGADPPPAQALADRLARADCSMRLVLRELSDHWERGDALGPGWPHRP